MDKVTEAMLRAGAEKLLEQQGFHYCDDPADGGQYARDITVDAREDAAAIYLAMSSASPAQEALERSRFFLNEVAFGASFSEKGKAEALALRDQIDAALSTHNSQPKAQQKPVVPSHWNGVGKYGSAFSFEPGLLGVNIGGYGAGDGNGYFAFKDEDLEYEQDDGPLYRTVNVANSELLAIRDHLNDLFPPLASQSKASTVVEANKVRALWNALHALEDRFGTLALGPALSALEAMHPLAATLSTEEAQLLRELRDLAVSLHRRHYPEVTQWQPLDDARGILSQIDNMTTGLERSAEPPSGVLSCVDCNLPYEGEHWVEAVVSPEDWLKISPTGHDGGILCINCMAGRYAALGEQNISVMLTAGPFIFQSTAPARMGQEDALRKALGTAAAAFRYYEHLHEAKDTDEGREKAARNRDLAEVCENALAGRVLTSSGTAGEQR